MNKPTNQLQEVMAFCELMGEKKHYTKKDPASIFAIVSKAKSLGLDPFDAINGGLYEVHGKIEMPAMTMNQLIRMGGHSVRVKELDDSKCTLTGKRKDNGDIMEVSFTYQEAQRAGIAKSGNWDKYRQDMLFARALSRLGRRLFPDLLKGCYVEGEIPTEGKTVIEEAELADETLTDLELKELRIVLTNCQSLDEATLLQHLKKGSLEEILRKDYDVLLQTIADYEKRNAATAIEHGASASDEEDDSPSESGLRGGGPSALRSAEPAQEPAV